MKKRGRALALLLATVLTVSSVPGTGSGGRGHKTPGWNDERTAVLKRNRRKLAV